jgi:hypothetical protein
MAMDRSAGMPRCQSPMQPTSYVCATPRPEYAGVKQSNPPTLLSLGNGWQSRLADFMRAVNALRE